MALAGVFRILNGKIRSHVQPDYNDIKHEYYDPEQMKCVKIFYNFMNLLDLNYKVIVCFGLATPQEEILI